MNSLPSSSQLVELFQKLVQIDSPTGHEQACALYIHSYLERECDLLPTQDVHGNVYCHVNGKGLPIILCAHMDTVEPGRNIHPKVIENQIVSDGTTILGADNKASISAILSVVSDIQHNRFSQNRPLDLIFTTSEESGNEGAYGFDLATIHATQGYIFDVGL